MRSFSIVVWDNICNMQNIFVNTQYEITFRFILQINRTIVNHWCFAKINKVLIVSFSDIKKYILL